MKNTTRIEQIAKQARKYGRTLRGFRCQFNATTGNFDYDIFVAKARSGLRGGHPRGFHHYTLTNLTPEERDLVRASFRVEQGSRKHISTN